MADLTQELDLGATWIDVTTAAGLTTDTVYAADLINVKSGTIVYQALTDDTDAPGAGITGHPWKATGPRDDAATRSYTQRSGQYLHMRAQGGTARLVLTEM